MQDSDMRTLMSDALDEIERLRAQLKESERSKREPIAVIGMGCRFPGGISNPADYWDLLKIGGNAVTEMNRERWHMDAFYDPDLSQPGKINSRFMGILKDIDQFDAELFGIAPVEAQCMDPQHRIFLETVWDAVEHAGYAPDSLKGSKTGVFLGISSQDYAHMQTRVGLLDQISPYDGTGNAGSVAAGRLSYLLGLQGPSMALDTACSSSLVAVNMACQSLRLQESNMVIAAGVGLILSPTSSIVFSKARMLAEDGKCKTFDADADGYVRAEGCGVLVLKRLSDAIKDGDNILALIRGTAVNQDGRSQGLTAPNEAAQERVILDALANGGVAPEQVSYVEAHGTGTSLGDPIEVGAIGAVYSKSHSKQKPLLIGSAKTNLGHMEAAAGMGGLIKVILSMQHRQLPPHMNYNKPNPHIEWDRYPVEVSTGLREWRGTGQNPDELFAGVSSFGFGGTNGHTILQSTPPQLQRRETMAGDRDLHLVNLSGKSPKALQELAQRYQQFLQNDPLPELGDIAFTSNVGRNHFSHRLSILARDINALRTGIQDFLDNKPGDHWLSNRAQHTTRKIAWFFSGQGAQYAGMGKTLYETQPTFRKALDRCAGLLSQYLPHPLLSVMWGDNSHLLSQTQYTQPALFAIEYALAEMWRAFGFQPARLIGHSVGEYAAACLAGVFSLEDACKLICARGRIMTEKTIPGAMISIPASLEQVEAALAGKEALVSIAAVNGPRNIVVSGDAATVQAIAEQFRAQNLDVKALEVSHAFHSPLMQPMLEEFRAVAESVQYHNPSIRIYSTLTGALAKEELANADYWVRHVAAPVQFEAAVRALFKQDDVGAVLEIGPHTTLVSLAAGFIDSDTLWLPTLRKGRDDWSTLLKSVAQLHQRGFGIQWKKLEADYSRKRVVLPTYPFQHKRFWLDHIPLGHSPADLEKGRHDWLYETAWKNEALTAEPKSAAGRKWLVISAQGTLARELTADLRKQGADVVAVTLGKEWQQESPQQIQLNPAHREQFDKLVAVLDTALRGYQGILYVADAKPSVQLDSAQLMQLQETLCGGLLHLVQAVTNTNGAGFPRLWVIGDNTTGQPEQALVNAATLGLAKVMAAEYPELKCVRLEVNGAASSQAVLAEILAEPAEDQVRLDGELRSVLRLQEVDANSVADNIAFKLKGDATYLITGGLGGLGIVFAKWMVYQGARHLVLTGRSGSTTPEQQEELNLLQQQGAHIEIARMDVTDSAAVAELVARIDRSEFPLAGVIHAAGVLDDGVIAQQNWSRFAKVFAPKLAGAWNLHTSTLHSKLDFFVLFSSVASILGLPGQSNYAAANTFLDALADFRTQHGLPVLAVNWGPWAQVGMAASENVRNRMARNSGVSSLTPAQGISLFSQIMGSPLHRVAVVAINWGQIAGMVAMVGITPPLLLDQLKKRGGEQFDLLNLSAEDLKNGGELKERLQDALPAERRKIITQYVRQNVVAVMGLGEDTDVESNQPLRELGLDSLMAVEIRNVLARGIGAPLPVSLLFDYPSIDALSAHLDEQTSVIEGQAETVAVDAVQPQQSAPAEVADTASVAMSMATATARMEATPASAPAITQTSQQDANVVSQDPRYRNAIAIIGMACRYPGHSNNPAAFWEVLKNGIDAVEDLGDKRWSLEEFYDPDPSVPGKVYSRWGGLVDQVDEFDNEFFGIAPVEATSMDPQQRLLLETSWEAIEYAGYSPTQFTGSQGAVFVGAGPNEYGQQAIGLGDPALINAYMGTGNSLSIAAGRISYTLGWQGPCSAIDTACSSSLVAIHLACQSLNTGESDIALAGGVNLTLSALTNITLSRAQMLSADGRCKTFDASANGYVRSEGCGMVFLKRLEDAVRDNDNILAIVRGTAINQDGRSQGLTAPNGLAQESVIRKALQRAQVNPSEIEYVEAHGTGTALGDPIEMRSIASVYGNAPRQQPLLVGSVKTNLGHTEVAAGAAGLIKIILSMQNGVIPPHLHLKQISPHLNLDTKKISIPTAVTPWNSSKRMAAVSSFGFSGTNSHAIIEQAPAQQKAVNAVDRTAHILTLSAKSPEALQAQIRNHLAFLKANPETNLADLCFTSNNGRNHFANRVAFVAQSSDNLLAQLQTFNTETLARNKFRSGDPVFLFSGQGSQYPNMGKTLYDTHAAFRQSMDRCNQLLADELEHSLLSVLWGRNTALLNQTRYTQPALFALEYSLAMLWRSWGVAPGLVMGHSVGEFAAACIAGAFSLEDGIRLIAARGRLMQELPEAGSMMAVMTDEALVQNAIASYGDELSIAAYNGPAQIAVSGRKDALEQLAAELAGQGIEVRPLDVSHAFHSALMQPMLAELEKVARSVKFQNPRVGVVSNLYGRVVKDEIAKADYWVRHVREPVRFAQGIAAIAKQKCSALIEMGPRPTLLGMGRNCVPDMDTLWLPSLRQGHDDWKQILSAVAELYQSGTDPDWKGFEQPYQRNRVVLPTYPFQRKRFWMGGDVNKFKASFKRFQLPMLGERLHTPGSKQIRFETLYNSTTPAYIGDHRLFGTIVVPGASHLALMLSAAQAAFGATQSELSNVCFLQPLVLGESEERHVHLVMDPKEDGVAFAELMSISVSGDVNDPNQWTVHCNGNIHYRVELETAQQELPWDDIKSNWKPVMASEAFYNTFANMGYNLGEAFQWLGDGWYNGPVAVRAVRWPKMPDNMKLYQLYPGLLDSFFQSLASCRPKGSDELAFESGSNNEIYIPFAMEKLKFYRMPEAGEALWLHSSLRDELTKDTTTTTGDIRLVDAAGKVVAEVIAIDNRKASRSALQQGMNKNAVDDWFYQPRWVSKPNENRIAPPAVNDAASRFVVLGKGDVLQAAVVQKLQAAQVPVLQLVPPSSAALAGPDCIALALDDHDALQTQLKLAFGEQGQLCLGILNLAGVHRQDGNLSLETMQVQQMDSCGTALALVQALSAIGWNHPPKLWLCTQQAQAIDGDNAALQLSQHALWGLGRVISMEHAELNPTRIDLALHADGTLDALDLDLLLRELLAGDGEDQIAIRRGVRHVERLESGSNPRTALHLPESDCWQVTVPPDGVLDHLGIVAADRGIVGPLDVEIRVRATALNFRDVLNALGMFKEFAERAGIDMPTSLPLGFDFAGEVISVGSEVKSLQPGDHVFGATMGSLRSHVITPEIFTVKKPEHLSFAQAAAIPTVFLTVYYGLKRLAGIKKGDKVLIHACAGGVGLAALQLAQQAGAEVYATASPGKWDFLRSRGVKHLFNSRNLDFADQIRELTDGYGVDMVLNSINGECIPKSLELLAPNGRFVEIGKIDVWSRERIAEVRSDVQYFLFDLTETLANDPQLLGSLMEEVAADYSAGKLEPLPLQTFPMSDMAAGFRHLAQARNIGKVVITNNDDLVQPPIRIHADRSYLITGGAGALGLKVADSLVRQGARHLLLTSRRQPDANAQAAIASLQQKDVSVILANADVSDEQQVMALMQRFGSELPPLSGIIHAAGVLDDGMLAQQNWSRFETVLAPKMTGTWNLHVHSQQQPLDLFVCFSSIASLLGSPGQGNYAAANAFLDGFMQFRRQQGLPGISINWGPWAEIGMAARTHVESRFSGSNGVNALLPEKAIEAFERVLQDNPPQVGIAAMEWDKLVANLGLTKPPAYYSHLRIRQAGASSSDIQKMAEAMMTQLREVAPSERQQMLIDALCAQLARVMGFDSPDKIRPNQPLQELGLDSLMAVEMRNVVNGFVGRALPATLLFKYPTLEELSGYLITELFPDHTNELADELGEAAPEENTAASTQNVDPGLVDSFTRRHDQDDIAVIRANLEAMSEEDAASMLAKRLAALKGETSQ